VATIHMEDTKYPPDDRSHIQNVNWSPKRMMHF
jgi:hypothetical protein